MNSKYRRFLIPLVVLSLVFVMAGCNAHPEVTSPEALDLIKQVYTACNTKNAQRLAVAKAELDELTEAGKLSVAEVETFGQIIAMAEDGNWEAAQKRAFRFAQSQIR